MIKGVSYDKFLFIRKSFISLSNDFLELISATVNVLFELNYVNCCKKQSGLRKIRF